MYLLLPKLATGIVYDLRALAWLGWACGSSGALGGNPYPQTWPPRLHSGELRKHHNSLWEFILEDD